MGVSITKVMLIKKKKTSLIYNLFFSFCLKSKDESVISDTYMKITGIK